MEDSQSLVTQAVRFIEEYRLLVEAHPVTAFLHTVNVPGRWIDYFEDWTYDRLVRLPSLRHQITEPELQNFVTEALSLAPAYPQYTAELPLSIFETWGMSPKKLHEVRRLGAFIEETARKLDIQSVIDLGSGLGYLSHVLTSRCGLSVQAVEGKTCHSHKAKERSDFLSRKLQQDVSSLKVTELHVTAETLQTENRSLIVGLHTCGDLAAVSAQIAVQQVAIRGLVSVGCCYHLITEKVPLSSPAYTRYLHTSGVSPTGEPLDRTFSSEGCFPLSNFVKTNFPGFYLGRSARILGLCDLKHELAAPQRYCFRAAFQCLLQEHSPTLSNCFSVGKIVKRFSDFGDYALQAAAQWNVDLPLTRKELNDRYTREYLPKEKRVITQCALRALFGPVIEHVILLDRVLYLREQGLETELWQIFQPQLSPRCWVLTAFKPVN